MSRLTRDEYFMEIARTVAKRSTCDRALVGAVLVQNNQIISTGYNGSVHGLAHCDEAGHLMRDGHCVRTIHAEQNALIQAVRNNKGVEQSTLYTTHFPCLICTKLLLNAGITRIVFSSPYQPDGIAFSLIHEVGVELLFLKGEL